MTTVTTVSKPINVKLNRSIILNPDSFESGNHIFYGTNNKSSYVSILVSNPMLVNVVIKELRDKYSLSSIQPCYKKTDIDNPITISDDFMSLYDFNKPPSPTGNENYKKSKLSTPLDIVDETPMKSHLETPMKSHLETPMKSSIESVKSTVRSDYEKYDFIGVKSLNKHLRVITKIKVNDTSLYKSSISYNGMTWKHVYLTIDDSFKVTLPWIHRMNTRLYYITNTPINTSSECKEVSIAGQRMRSVYRTPIDNLNEVEDTTINDDTSDDEMNTSLETPMKTLNETLNETPMKTGLRPFQEEVVNHMINRSRHFFNIFCGCGKTRCYVEYCRRNYTKEVIVIVVPSILLAEQTRKYFDDLHIDVNVVYTNTYNEDTVVSNILIVVNKSYSDLHNEHILDKFRHPDVVIFDEAHHDYDGTINKIINDKNETSVSNNTTLTNASSTTYDSSEYNTNNEPLITFSDESVIRFYFSATLPTDLLNYYDTYTFDYYNGVNKNYIVPLTIHIYKLEHYTKKDIISKISELVNEGDKDYINTVLDRILVLSNKNKNKNNDKTRVGSIKVSKALKKSLESLNVSSKVYNITSDTSKSERNKILDEFHKRDSIKRIISACRVFSEGYDEPSIKSVMMYDNRHSLTSLIQSCSRCNRIDPNDPNKKEGHVILFSTENNLDLIRREILYKLFNIMVPCNRRYLNKESHKKVVTDKVNEFMTRVHIDKSFNKEDKNGEKIDFKNILINTIIEQDNNPKRNIHEKLGHPIEYINICKEGYKTLINTLGQLRMNNTYDSNYTNPLMNAYIELPLISVSKSNTNNNNTNCLQLVYYNKLDYNVIEIFYKNATKHIEFRNAIVDSLTTYTSSLLKSNNMTITVSNRQLNELFVGRGKNEFNQEQVITINKDSNEDHIRSFINLWMGSSYEYLHNTVRFR